MAYRFESLPRTLPRKKNRPIPFPCRLHRHLGTLGHPELTKRTCHCQNLVCPFDMHLRSVRLLLRRVHLQWLLFSLSSPVSDSARKRNQNRPAGKAKSKFRRREVKIQQASPGRQMQGGRRTVCQVPTKWRIKIHTIGWPIPQTRLLARHQAHVYCALARLVA